MKGTELLARPGPQDHLVQFYDEDSSLSRNVALYLKEGAEQGDRMIVVATPSHVRLFKEALKTSEVDADDLVRDGRLHLLDAEETLRSLQIDGELNWPHFERKVRSLLREINPDGSGLRAYGEMVDLLWKAGRLGDATRLEEFWNRLHETMRFSLYCSYTVDLLGPGTTGADLQEMITMHTHLLPMHGDGALEAAVNRAMDEILGPQTLDALLPLIRANVSRVVLPEAERIVMWLRKNLPPYANDVLSRARAYFTQACTVGAHR